MAKGTSKSARRPTKAEKRDMEKQRREQDLMDANAPIEFDSASEEEEQPQQSEAAG